MMLSPPSLAHFGPQDIERGVVDSAPSREIETLPLRTTRVGFESQEAH